MPTTWNDLSPTDAAALLQREPNVRVLDVRTRREYDRWHIDGALLLPVQELAMRVEELDTSTVYLVTCEHGMRSVAACRFLAGRGFARLHNLVGGMAEWVEAGLPVQSAPAS